MFREINKITALVRRIAAIHFGSVIAPHYFNESYHGPRIFIPPTVDSTIWFRFAVFLGRFITFFGRKPTNC